MQEIYHEVAQHWEERFSLLKSQVQGGSQVLQGSGGCNEWVEVGKRVQQLENQVRGMKDEWDRWDSKEGECWLGGEEQTESAVGEDTASGATPGIHLSMAAMSFQANPPISSESLGG